MLQNKNICFAGFCEMTLIQLGFVVYCILECELKTPNFKMSCL